MSTTTKQQSDCDALMVMRSARLSAEPIPRRVLIAPWGEVESTNGRFVLDEEGAALAVEAFSEHGTDLPIDYEHQTLGGPYASPNGQAPAAGWIKKLSAEPGVGLVAEIEWTKQAEKMLAAKEYRYLSPVAIIRRGDRKLTALHSVALTNKPAIVGMQPIVGRDSVPAGDEHLAQLRADLDLPAHSEAYEVLVAAGQRLAELREEAARRHIDERIGEAMRAGKLVEAQRAWAEALVAREEGLFDQWLRTAPVIVQPGKSVPPADAAACSQREQSIAIRARAEYRSNPLLQRITSEEAYVAEAVREQKIGT